jgi:hypothetical protein
MPLSDLVIRVWFAREGATRYAAEQQDLSQSHGATEEVQGFQLF